MEPDVALNQLSHQAVQRPAAGGHELQDVFVLGLTFTFERPFDGFYLALNSADSRQLLSLVLCRVRQFISPAIVYTPILSR